MCLEKVTMVSSGFEAGSGNGHDDNFGLNKLSARLVQNDGFLEGRVYNSDIRISRKPKHLI